MAELSKEWSDYDHTKGYEKAMQDIMLANGDIVTKCWPNAGFWNVCEKEDNEAYYGKDIPVKMATKTRLTHDENW